MANYLGSSPTKPPSKSNPTSILLASAGIVISLTAALFIAGVANIMQVLIVFVGLAAFIGTFSRLEFGVVAMIVILYAQTYIIVGERYGVTDVIQGLIMLLGLSMGTRWSVYTNEFPQGWLRPLLLVMFYCVVALASVMYAKDTSAAMTVAFETVKSGIIALFIAVTLKTSNSFRMAVWGLLVTGIFLGTISVIQFTLGNYSNDYGGYAQAALTNISGQTNDYRLGGPVGDPNFYAQMMLVLVPLALDRFWNERSQIARFFAAWALGVCSFTVLLTYSRGGFLSMALVVVAMIVIFYRGQARYLLAVFVVGLLLMNVLPARFTERIGTLTELLPGSSSPGVAKDYSFRGRTSEMIVALQMFADHPILGVGVGNYPILYQQYSQRLGLDLRSEVRQAHSLYLEVASETGLLGLFSFGILLWGIVKFTWKYQRELEVKGLRVTANMVAAYGFGFIGYLTAALFIHSAYPRNFWVLAGIALAIPRMAEVEIESVEKIKRRLTQGWR